MCSKIIPLISRVSLLILQHPQEARNPATTARLVSLSLKDSVHKVGLSWRSLGHALGREADLKRWAVLYLGTKVKSEKFKHLPFCIIDRTEKILKDVPLDGIVVLDGNWKQSKALWWRNPWLLRMNRIILNPKEEALFDQVRKEPRKNCLSTIESVGMVLKHLEGKSSSIDTSLQNLLKEHISLLQALH